MAASRKPKPAAASSGSTSFEIILPTVTPKKHSVRFETSEQGVAVNNVYISSAAYQALGRPDKLKITVEAADE